MACIFCGIRVDKPSVEHIVPESLGNLYYTLPLGSICGKCNNMFSEFEDKALSKTMLGFERARYGIPTKKGKPAVAKSKGLSFTGSSNFIKNRVIVNGLNQENVQVVKNDGSFIVHVQDFDKSDMATAKLILKIGYEALYRSQRKIFKNHDFSQLKNHLLKIDNAPWPIMTLSLNLVDFNSIPKYIDKHRLKKRQCEIKFKEVSDNIFLVEFRYGVLKYLVNAKSKDISWARDYFLIDSKANLYPEHLQKNLLPLRPVEKATF
jgi:hypothetical protein